MQREAFSRAWRFLGYKPVAKWSAVTAAVLTGILYVGLLVVLALFADLLVNRGKIPSFAELPPRQQERFLDDWQSQPDEERAERLRQAGVAQPEAKTEASRLTRHDPELLWRQELRDLLGRRVGPGAAAVVSDDPNGADLEDRGILSLVVRTRGQLNGPLAGVMARLAPWTWERPEGRPNYPGYLTGLLLIAVVLALLRGGAMFVMSYAASVAAAEAAARLRRAIYHHTFRLGTLAFRALGPSEAVGIFTRQVEAVHDALYTMLTVVCREPVKFGLLLLFAFAVDPLLALIFLVAALLVWVVGGQIAVSFRRQERAASRAAAEQLALLQESLMLMRLVKCYLMELFNQSRVERQLAAHTEAQLRRDRGEALYRPVLVLLGTLAAVVILWVAGLLVWWGRVGVATAITLAAALVSLYLPTVNWLDRRRFVRRGREAAGVVFQFLDRPGEVGQVVGAEFLPPLSRQLEFMNVTLKEPGTGRTLLDGVTLNIRAGNKVAIVGADDMEKHALIYLIPRFLDPTSGEILIDGHNLRWVTFESLRAQIAIVLQHNLVFNDTVRNNIGCGDAGYDLPKIIEAAKIAHAHHFIQKLPHGYETSIGEMGHYLGISERFRIALARAVLRDPAILIIEEPLAPLDDDSKALLDDTYTRILPGRTVIFLPHRISTIRSCDQVFLLHQGRVEAAGEHRTLLSGNQLYRHLQYIEFNEFAEVT